MKAVVMAGGQGSRLRPLTVNYPKTMIPLVNKPVLGHILHLLRQHHVDEVILAVGRLSEYVRAYVQDGRHLGLTVHYSEEEVPLGTAGSIKNAQRYLDDGPFFVISGDVVTDMDLRRLWQFHRQSQAMATLALKHVADPHDSGVALTDTRGRIRYYQEKPGAGPILSHTVNTGIYVLEPAVLDAYLEPGVASDFSYDVFSRMAGENAPLFGYSSSAYWRDVGTIPNYVKAAVDILSGKVRSANLGDSIGAGVWVGRNVKIDPGALLYGPVYLGHGARVRDGAAIYGPTVVGDDAIIDRGAQVKRSIIGPNAFIGKSANLDRAIVPRQCSVTRSYASAEVLTTEDMPQEVAVPLPQNVFYTDIHFEGR